MPPQLSTLINTGSHKHRCWRFFFSYVTSLHTSRHPVSTRHSLRSHYSVSALLKVLSTEYLLDPYASNTTPNQHCLSLVDVMASDHFYQLHTHARIRYISIFPGVFKDYPALALFAIFSITHDTTTLCKMQKSQTLQSEQNQTRKLNITTPHRFCQIASL